MTLQIYKIYLIKTTILKNNILYFLLKTELCFVLVSLAKISQKVLLLKFSLLKILTQKQPLIIMLIPINMADEMTNTNRINAIREIEEFFEETKKKYAQSSSKGQWLIPILREILRQKSWYDNMLQQNYLEEFIQQPVRV